MVLILRALACSLVPALAAAACAPGTSGADASGRVRVVAGAYPLAQLALAVGGTRVSVTDLTPAGAEPHDLDLTPDQAATIEDAGVVLVLGGGFQPGVEALAHRYRRTLDLTKALGLDRDDPHVWLDPSVMARAASVVAGALAARDPGRRGGYQRRAQAWRREMAHLDSEYRTGLARCRTRTLVTAHDAFARLAARYRLDAEGIAGVGADAEPDPRRLAALADLARRKAVTTVFTERLLSPRIARTLAREAGVRTAVLDPLESDPSHGAGGTSDIDGRYVAGMRRNLAALRAGLGCR